MIYQFLCYLFLVKIDPQALISFIGAEIYPLLNTTSGLRRG